jgi:hypothetical protein
METKKRSPLLCQSRAPSNYQGRNRLSGHRKRSPGKTHLNRRPTISAFRISLGNCDILKPQSSKIASLCSCRHSPKGNRSRFFSVCSEDSKIENTLPLPRSSMLAPGTSFSGSPDGTICLKKLFQRKTFRDNSWRPRRDIDESNGALHTYTAASGQNTKRFVTAAYVSDAVSNIISSSIICKVNILPALPIGLV